MPNYTAKLVYPDGQSFDRWEGPVDNATVRHESQDANNVIDALLRCVQANHTRPDRYHATVTWAAFDAGYGVHFERSVAGAVTVHADLSITIGTRWIVQPPLAEAPPVASEASCA